jgi:hypothetical protein
VIAPDWSGYVDFLYMPVKNKKGRIRNKSMFAAVDCKLEPILPQAVWENILVADSQWCYPDQGSFKIKLREVYKDYGRFAKQAKQLQEYIKENLSEEKQNKMMSDIILSTLNLQDQKDLEVEDVQVF